MPVHNVHIFAYFCIITCIFCIMLCILCIVSPISRASHPRENSSGRPTADRVVGFFVVQACRLRSGQRDARTTTVPDNFKTLVRLVWPKSPAFWSMLNSSTANATSAGPKDKQGVKTAAGIAAA